MSRLASRWIPVLLLVALLVGITPHAHATPLPAACTNGVGDVVSLRNAIDSAISGDTIELGANCLYSFLTADLNDTNTALRVADNRTLTVNGHNAIVERFDNPGTPLFRLFTLSNGANLTFNDVTLRNGLVGDGGAILVDTSSVTLNFSTLTENHANNSGGAISSFGGSSVNINNSTLSKNFALASEGGAIFSSDPGSSVNVNTGTFTENNALTNGGAIANGYQLGSVTVVNSTFTSNKAGSSGGAIYNGSNGGLLDVSGSTFTNNSVTGGSVFGGAIANGGGSSTQVTNSTFAGNFVSSSGGAGYGGAIASSRDDVANGITTLTVIGSTFTGLSPAPSADTGGGIWNASGGTLNVTGSTFTGNQAVQDGGAIKNDGYGGLPTQATVSSSSFSANSAMYGGAISNTADGDLTAASSTFTGNTAQFGGGINNAAVMKVINSTISGNIGGSTGGGINNGGVGVLTVTNSTIIGNESLNNGAGIFDSGPLTPLIVNNTIIANNTGSEDCAGVNLPPTISHTLIKDSSCNVVDGVDGNIAGVDPNLGALGNNGGATQTMALLSGSPAIDAGDNALAVDAGGNPLATDQRGAGFPRISGSAVDLGAFEVQSEAPPHEQPSGASQSAAPAGTPIDALCAAFGSLTSSQISASGGGSTFCHLIALNGQFVTNPAEIGIQSVIDLGVIDAINVYALPPGTFSPVQVCLRGSGDILFISAADHTIQRLPVGADGCVLVTSPGIVVKVRGQSGIAAPPPAAPGETPLSNCQVTTTDAPLNLRAEPNTSAPILAKLPFDLTLTATASVPGWFKVVYLDGQGWVSEQFVSTLGDCGG